jgi:hypothetical protein
MYVCVQIHDLAEEVKDFVPEKADEVLSAEEQGKIKDYISRQGVNAAVLWQHALQGALGADVASSLQTKTLQYCTSAAAQLLHLSFAGSAWPPLARNSRDRVVVPASSKLSAHCRATDLLLLEVDAEVQEFVCCLKDWPLKWYVAVLTFLSLCLHSQNNVLAVACSGLLCSQQPVLKGRC